MAGIYIRNVDDIVAATPTWFLVEVLGDYLKSNTYAYADRKRIKDIVTNGPKLEGYTATPGFEIFPDHRVSNAQMKELRHGGWAIYISFIIEEAFNFGEDPTLDDMVFSLEEFMVSLGRANDISNLGTKHSKGVLSAALLLGGYTFKSKRKGSTSYRVVTPVLGTELLSKVDRLTMALKNCETYNIDERNRERPEGEN